MELSIEKRFENALLEIGAQLHTAYNGDAEKTVESLEATVQFGKENPTLLPAILNKDNQELIVNTMKKFNSKKLSFLDIPKLITDLEPVMKQLKF